MYLFHSFIIVFGFFRLRFAVKLTNLVVKYYRPHEENLVVQFQKGNLKSGY